MDIFDISFHIEIFDYVNELTVTNALGKIAFTLTTMAMYRLKHLQYDERKKYMLENQVKG